MKPNAMIRYLIIFLFVILFSCVSKTGKEIKPIYKEVLLRSFVLSTQAIDEQMALKQLDSILKEASKDSMIFIRTVYFLVIPLSDPNSAYRNQTLYSKLLESEIESKWYSSYEKEIAERKLKLIQQNNVGDSANDFTYVTTARFKKKMYDINARFLLLYFNNPECNACKEMKQALAASSMINQKQKTGKLKILSIYTDTDEKLWLDHLNEYPDQWIQGRDENEYLYKNKVYDLKAIPTVYLLDSNKRVLLKDCVDVREIENIVSSK